MKLYEIYFSPTGGTEAVSDCLAQAFSSDRERIDLCDASADFDSWTFSAEDVCLIAVPSYGGRVPETALERLNRMDGGGAAAIAVAVYGNRAYDDTLLELKDNLTADGFRCVAAVAAVAEHSIMRQFAFGRPDAQDRAELAAFSQKICQAIASGSAPAAITVPGSKPYREYGGVPLKPKAGKACKSCGLCAQKCPVGAIPADNPSDTDTGKCISCMRCIAVCPQHARACSKAMLLIASQKLKKACKDRKENELFL